MRALQGTCSKNSLQDHDARHLDGNFGRISSGLHVLLELRSVEH